MKKILKKLISVPNKFEAFLQRRKLPTLILILVFCLFTLFNLWWYGAYENLFKTDREYSSWEDEKLFSMDVTDEEDVFQYYKKVFSQMTTEAVIQNLLRNASALSGPSPLDFPDLEGWYEWLSQSTLGQAGLEVLNHRNNVGTALVKVYRNTSVVSAGDEGSLQPVMKLCYLEILLLRSEYQKHLPLWDRWTLGLLADQKQKEKYGDAETADDMNLYRYNYLYTDAYDENGWNEEKLNEHASKYIDLEEWGLTE